MSSVNKITADRNLKILQELASKPGNDACADCKARNPRWASHNLGIFICVSCASVHRKIGTHVTKVKSLTMDSWSKEQIESMRNIGNAKSNEIYNPNEIRNPPPVSTMDGERDSEMEQYIRSKYEYRRFINRAALAPPRLETKSVATSTPTRRPSRSPTTTGLGVPTRTSGSITRTRPAAPTRSSSQPGVPNGLQSLPPPTSFHYPQTASIQQQPAPQQQEVWADLVSLQAPSQASSLPLQYQSQPQQMPVATGMPMQGVTMFSNNPFPLTQQQQPAPNPFSQQQPSFQPSPNPFTQQQQQQPSFQSNPNPFSQQQPSFQPSPNPFMAQLQQQQQTNGFGQQPQVTGFSPTNPFAQQQAPSAFPMQSQLASPQPMVQSPIAQHQQPMMQSNFLSPQTTMSPTGMSNGYSTPSPQPFPPQVPGSQFNGMTPSPQPNFMPQSNYSGQQQQPQQQPQQQFAQWAMPQQQQNTMGFNGMGVGQQQQQQQWGTM